MVSRSSSEIPILPKTRYLRKLHFFRADKAQAAVDLLSRIVDLRYKHGCNPLVTYAA